MYMIYQHLFTKQETQLSVFLMQMAAVICILPH